MLPYTYADFPLSKLPRFLSNDPTVVRTHFSHMVDDGELTATKAEERAAFASEVQPAMARLKPKVRNAISQCCCAKREPCCTVCKKHEAYGRWGGVGWGGVGWGGVGWGRVGWGGVG